MWRTMVRVAGMRQVCCVVKLYVVYGGFGVGVAIAV